MKLNRKGSTHTDWIVSLALFIIAVVFFLSLLKPGQEEVSSPENLFKIIESGLDAKMDYKINRTVIIPTLGTAQRIVLTGITITPGDFAYTYDGALNNNVYSLFSDSETCVYSKVYLLNSQGKYASSTQDTFCSSILSPTQTNGIITTTETLEGIDGAYLSLNSLCSDAGTYQSLKEEWRFPQQKEFKITILDSAELIPAATPNGYDLCSVETFGEQDNVFIKDKMTWVLNKDGTKQGVIVRVSIW